MSGFPPPLPPEEAIRWFKRKGYAVGFNWKDIWQEQHAVGFTVAKAMRIDLLEDIKTELEKAFETGVPFREFKKQLQPILEKKGWWGKSYMIDPKTNKLKKVQLGSPRRLRIIYDTNMRMAHAEGRWERIERNKENRPYLRYVAVMDSRTRQDHKNWHGTVLPVDHKFWNTHFPPNGWMCRCIVQQLSEYALNRYGYEVSDEPNVALKDWTDKRSNKTLKIPEGIDPGFAYNVGKTKNRFLAHTKR